MSELSSALVRLEGVLADLTKPLVTLAAAGVLVGMGLTLREGENVCGASILLDHDDVGEAEVADFSALRLLVSPEAEVALELICQDSALGRMLVETALLPVVSTDTLACTGVRWQGSEAAPEVRDEDILDALEEEEETADEYDDGDGESWG